MSQKLRSAVSFFLLNLATPVVFFWTFRLAGAKPAIAFAIGVSALQTAFHLWLKARMSPFFMVASGFTVGFGLLDLVVTAPQFFRLQPFAQNLLVGLVFLFSALTRYPIVTWFAAALPPFVRPEMDEETSNYLRNVTWAWATYLLVKALIFLYLAFRVDLGSLILLRSVIGGGSLALMIVGEIIFRKYFRRNGPLRKLSGKPKQDPQEVPRRSGRSG